MALTRSSPVRAGTSILACVALEFAARYTFRPPAVAACRAVRLAVPDLVEFYARERHLIPAVVIFLIGGDDGL